MQPNVGRTDAGIRWALAAILFTLSIVYNSLAFLSLLAALGALVMVATALTGKCPFYTLFGIDTYHRSSPAPR